MFASQCLEIDAVKFFSLMLLHYYYYYSTTKCHSSYWLLFHCPGVNNTPREFHVLKFRYLVLYEGSLQSLVDMSFVVI